MKHGFHFVALVAEKNAKARSRHVRIGAADRGPLKVIPGFHFYRRVVKLLDCAEHRLTDCHFVTSIPSIAKVPAPLRREELFGACLGDLQIPPKFLVCDIFMPQMDGFEFLAKLVELQFSGGVIMMTGGDPEMLRAAKHIGIASGLKVLGTFLKPVTSAQLSAALVD